MMNEGIQPVVNLATQGQGYSSFGNGFGGDWWAILILLILFGAFGGNGFGGNGFNSITNDTLLNGEFIKRDIFSTNQNVSSTASDTQKEVLESRYTTQLGLQQLQATQQNCCCELGNQIANAKYDSALQNQALQAQIAQCCCDLRAEGLQNAQRILDTLCQDKIDNLRDQLQTANFQLSQQAQSANLISQLRPTPIPSYIVTSPYVSYGYGYNCGCNGF